VAERSSSTTTTREMEETWRTVEAAESCCILETIGRAKRCNVFTWRHGGLSSRNRRWSPTARSTFWYICRRVNGNACSF
jgi:hypothetical protein